MIRFAWTLLGTLLAGLPLGCRLAERPDLNQPDLEVLPIDASTEPDSTDVARSREVLLIADNQFRYTGGDGIVMTSALVDVFVPTAARPIALNAFSDDVFHWCLEQNPGRPVLHLGDACDISCVIEFTWFAEIMRDHGEPWAMLPGNHDSMFMGSMMEQEGESDSWTKACDGGGGTMDKADFVALYLATLWDQIQDQPGGDALAAALGSSRDELLRDLPEPGLLSDRYPLLAERIRESAPQGSWSQGREDAFLTGLAWNIDEENTWRSFIAQRVSLTDPALPSEDGFTGILLDSSQWWHEPQLIPLNIVPPYEWNPGLSGELLADQLHVIADWMNEAAAQGDGIALFAHHPVKEFTPKSRRALEYLWTNFDVIMLASGHTHAGYVDVHSDIGPTALEINVASITDWPMEWRGLQLSRYRRGDQAYFGVSSPRHTMLDELVRTGTDLREEWATFEEGAQHFLSYRVSKDLAMDYDTGIGDLLTNGQWLKMSVFGTVAWLVLGQETLARRLYDNVLPNIKGLEAEHLARQRLEIGQLMQVWDEFPTTGHSTDEDWAAREAELRKLAALALEDDSTKQEVHDASWPIVSFELERQVAEPEKMRRYRIMLAVWASMYEANRATKAEVRDNSFRMIHGERVGAR